jgi:hypothetical protein
MRLVPQPEAYAIVEIFRIAERIKNFLAAEREKAEEQQPADDEAA